MTMFFRLPKIRVHSILICAAITSIFLNATCARAQDAPAVETSLVLQAAEQNLGIPTLDNTYSVDRANPLQSGGGQGAGPQGPGNPLGGGVTDDPYDNLDEQLKNDVEPFSIGDFLANPGLFFSKYWSSIMKVNEVRSFNV